MNSGHFFKAAFKPLNFLWLLITLTAFFSCAANFFAHGISSYYVYFSAFAALTGAAIYTASVVQTMKNRVFLMDCRQDDRINELYKLSSECSDLYRKTSKKIDRNSKNRMHSVLRQKDELMRYFKGCSDDLVKQTIVERALKLVMAYFNLGYSYIVRSKENSAQNIKAINQRINYNNRKLGALKSYDAVLELMKSIEMDEKLLENIKMESHELEKISVRLNYIESTINVFKHRIISTESSDPEVEEIERIINEATALDNVLNERRKIRN